LPEKRNKKNELSFDKSIYFACKFLSERKFRVLTKVGIPLGRKLKPLAFFKEIKDFQTVKFEGEILNLEKKALRSLDKSITEKEASEKNAKRTQDSHRKFASLSTTQFVKRIHGNSKKVARKTTGTTSRVVRKTARKRTTKEK
jgi:hypothetical protein